MRKTGKKFLLLVAVLALAVSMFAGCAGSYTFQPLQGYESAGEVTSNGGSVVQKGDWIYFINGVESNTSSNTYGSVVKGALMRISSSALSEGEYDSAEIVVPEIVYDGGYDAGIFIEGDYVYYATPNNTRNMQAQIENSWLNFKRAKLDGSDVLSGTYAQLEIGNHSYRYVVEDGVVYLLYADTANSEIHSVNTQTMQDVTLVKGYASYAFDSEDLTSPTVYYTMKVAKKVYNSDATVQYEDYQQLYTVSAAVTEAPREYDLSEGYGDLEYVNLGTLVLDGIGSSDEASVFNPDRTDTNVPKGLGFTYAIEKLSKGDLYFTVTFLPSSGDSSSYVCRLSGQAYGAAASWNTIQANPTRTEQGVASEGGAITLVSSFTAKASETALYYTEGDTQYFLYVDSDSSNIFRVSSSSAGGSFSESSGTLLASAQEGATLLFLDEETGFVYYSRKGTNGNALWRIRYDGQDNYYTGIADTLPIENPEDYKATQYLGIDYNSSWFVPELVGGRIFFANADTYAGNNLYVTDACATNKPLTERNDNYQAVQDLFTEVEAKFSAAANAMRYYYYGGDVTVITDEKGEYREEYTDEDVELINAYVAGTDLKGFGFAKVKDVNRQTAYVHCIGKVTDAEKTSLSQSLQSAYVSGYVAPVTAEAGWTWQWAALFVPIGVVVIGGGIAAFLIVRRRRIR